MTTRYATLDAATKAFAENFEESSFGYMNLQGIDNARDLGGMPTLDGRVIKPARLIRSGRLEHASAEDVAFLRDMHLSCVIDFRMEQEREKAPDPTKKFPDTSFEFIPVVNPSGGGTSVSPGNSLREVLKEANGSTDSAEKFVHQLYRELFLSEAGRAGYRQFFECVLEHAEANPEGAILWHCSAGKDRTGAAAVLLEHALGVPHELILADYMASNLFTTTLVARAMEDLSDLTKNANIEELVHMYYGVAKDNLECALAALNEQYGSLDVYLESQLGVTPNKKKQLQDLLLATPR